jgi:hypothetical protein
MTAYLHPYKRIKIQRKIVKIDEKMVGFIKWMNKIPGVRTFYCCQGGSQQKPYVLYQCDYQKTLLKLMKLFEKFDVFTTVDCYQYEGDKLKLRYITRFHDKNAFNKFKLALKLKD